MELKPCNSQLYDYVVGIWVKQHSSQLSETDPVRWSCPTYPYQIKNVEQVFPGKEHIERFESKRNELDERLSHGKIKLETIHGFYCPSSEDAFRAILQHGFDGAISGELVFCTDPLQAIRESLSARPLNKLFLARVSLGWKGYDYSEINNKYKIKDTKGVLPSFIIHIEPFPHPKEQEAAVSPVSPKPVYEEPPKPRVEPTTPTSPSGANVRLPKYITELDTDAGGIPCTNCGRIAGPGSSGRYCIQCGTKIP